MSETRTIADESGYRSYSQSYSYDALGRSATITYPNGEVVTNTYNSEGLPATLNGLDDYVTQSSYNARGQLLSLSRGNGVDTSYSYYSVTEGFRLESAMTVDAGAGNVLDLGYDYDDVGNITGLTSQYGMEAVETLSFSYDALDRLTGVSGAYSRSYSYDALGNLLVLGENSYSYGGAQPHAVTQVTGPAGSHSYGYDANGNMSSRIEHGVSYTQTFDIENRLTLVDATGSGGMINEYLYDAGGQRLRTVESNTMGQALKRTFYPFANYEEEVRETPIALNILAEPGVEPEICLVKVTATTWAYVGGSDKCVSGVSMVYQLPAAGEISPYDYYGFMITHGSEMAVVLGSAGPALYQQLPDFPQAGTTTLVWRTADWQDVSHTLNVSLVPAGAAPQFLNTPGITFQAEKPVTAGTEAVSTLQRSTYRFGGQVVAVREWNGGGSVLTYLHSDHLGSAGILTDEAGNVVAGSVAKYYPFGSYRERPATNPTTTELGFTGHKHNDSVGMVYANARFYLPQIGRFASADSVVPEPSQPQDFNRYAYTLNNSLKYTDPSGHLPSSGCDYEGCNLPQGLDPNNTWIDNQGTYYSYDPYLAKRYPGRPPSEVVAYTALGLGVAAATPIVLEYVAGNIVYSGLVQIGSTITSWLCLNDGDCTNEGELGLDAFSRATEFGIQKYSELTKATAGTGLQAHHIIEKRLAAVLGIQDTRSILSVALTVAEHQVFTNAWRTLIPYGSNYSTLTREQIWVFAQEVYASYPALLDAAKTVIFGQ